MHPLKLALFVFMISPFAQAQEYKNFAKSYLFQLERLYFSQPQPSEEQFLRVHVDLIGRSNGRITKGFEFPLGYLPMNQGILNLREQTFVVRAHDIVAILRSDGLLDRKDTKGYDLTFSIVRDRIFLDQTLTSIKIPLEDLHRHLEQPIVIQNSKKKTGSQLVVEVLASEQFL